MSIYHQNTFSRTLANEGKMGAYYTDVEHCKSISKMFRFPENEEVCVLEPSIGDGKAVITVTNADKNPNIKIFGVELNDQTADMLRENPYMEDVLKADFLNDVFITNNAFSFCFGNPPYLDDSMDGTSDRTERSFLEKVGNYLMTGAILVWVIPLYIYQKESYLRYWNSRYETLALFRFRPAEYKKYQQIVIVGRKRKLSVMLSKDQMEEYQNAVADVELVPELPDDFSEKIDILPSVSSNVTTFATRTFDVALAYNALSVLPNELLSEFDSHVTVKPYAICSIGRPPIPLKKDSMYLLATSGGGQGLTGSEETNDLHLQRGVAEVIEDSVVETTGTGKNVKTQARVVSRTQVSMTVIQNNGSVSKLV